MEHIKTISETKLNEDICKKGCGECQSSCQSACKTSETAANLRCEKDN
ncbi:MAG: six-cysteine ranthipeptide SCIFF [Oscillospiraceae bacterium]|nr:six-cysteine ranthipeptide SCIFF [Oscillospiraceae bacterium]